MSIIGAAQQQDRNRAGTTLFTPSDIPGLVFRMDPRNTASVSATSSAVTQANDLSGLSNHATQSSPSLRPLNTGTINGHPAFTLSNNALSLTAILGSGPCTMVMVFKDISASISTFFGSAGNSYIPITDAGSSTTILSNIEGNNSSTGRQHLFDGESVQSVTTRGNLHDKKIASTLYMFSATESIDDNLIELGRGGQSASYDLTGEMGEVLIYSGTLTLADKQKIQGYCAWGWGFQASLGAGHPYFSAAPTS